MGLSDWRYSLKLEFHCYECADARDVDYAAYQSKPDL